MDGAPRRERGSVCRLGRGHGPCVMTDWMSLRKQALTWWHGRNSGPELRNPVIPIERPTHRVPAEYRSLHTYLDRRYASVVVLTFEQMEALLGFALPAPASTDNDWWTGAAVTSNRYAEAWTGAGRTARPNLPARTVTFERLS